jgi:hypothetical protein
VLDTFEKIIYFFNNHLIRGIFISVFVILFAKKISKNKIETDTSLQVIRWTILLYALGNTISVVFSIIIKDKEEYFFLKQLTNVNWFMLIANSIIPLTLFYKTFGKRIFYILAISLLMNFGWLFESFIIHVPAISRSFDTGNYYPFLPFKYELEILTKGFIFGIVSLIIGKGISSLKE